MTIQSWCGLGSDGCGECDVCSLQTEIEQLRRERDGVQLAHDLGVARENKLDAALREATARAERAEAVLRRIAEPVVREDLRAEVAQNIARSVLTYNRDDAERETPGLDKLMREPGVFEED